MTQSPPPEQSPSPRRPLTSDDLIGILVAFASMGAIFFWAISRDSSGFNFSILKKAVVPQPTASPSPLVGSSPAPSPTITAAPVRPTVPRAIAPVEQPLTQSAPVPSSSPVQSASQHAPVPVPAEQSPAQPVPIPVPVPVQPASPPKSAVPPKATEFSDVPSGYWATPFLEELARRNVIGRYQDGTFQP
ncbi:MAG: S-layer homology domain-containing protein, partial [Kovacikia sp.]